ncbi:hypothetical protein F4818DRAFT_434046 [Hypoxylon cercidicola]|nr:hypothetical protein F4818DRAFT_434046 [Hypoxylon cercidicola]
MDLGVATNIMDIGLVMMWIITGEINMMPPLRAVVRITKGTARVFKSYSNLSTKNYPKLDPDLADLVNDCCARDLRQRPTLEELFLKARTHFNERNAHYYRRMPSGNDETNESIQNLMRTLIFNAET